MKGLLGVKVGMTQIIGDDGVVMPVTVIQAGPCYVTQVKHTYDLSSMHRTHFEAEKAAVGNFS